MSSWLNEFKSGAAATAQRMAPGWEQGFDNKSGRTYYFNRQTQQSSWDMPTAAEALMIPSHPAARSQGQQSGIRNTGARGGSDGYSRGNFDSGMDRNRTRDDDNAWRGGRFGARDRDGDRGGKSEGKGDRGRDESWPGFRGKGGDDRKGGKGDREGWGKGGRGKDGDDRYERSRDDDRWWGDQESTGVVSYRGQEIDDDSLPSGRDFTRRVANCEELNLAENYITGSGLSWILKPCNRFPHLRVLKLHKNEIGDSAAGALVRLCKNAPGLKEMHLSHNRLTWVGADKIVPAACERQIIKNAEGGDPSLWLRLEQNQVEDPKSLFHDWQQRGLMVSLYHKSDAHTPKGVILPYFMSQRHGGESYRRDEGWGGRWKGGSDYRDDSYGSWKGGKGGYDSWDYSPKGKGKGDKGKGKHSDGDAKGSKGGKGKDEKGKGKGKDDKKQEGGKGKGSKKGAMIKDLKDDTLEEFCKKHTEESAEDKVIDISCNHLTGANFGAFRDLCVALTQLTIVKLHKNLLADVAGPILGEMCKDCPLLSELHLSHNMFTRTGAEAIVSAACEARKKDDEKALPPLWLRLEYNEIEEPQTLVDDWKSRELCVTSYSKGTSRHNLPKGVHVPYFLTQGKPTGYVHGEERHQRQEKAQEKESGEKKWKPKATEADKEKKEKSGKDGKSGVLKWKPKVQSSPDEQKDAEKKEDGDADEAGKKRSRERKAAEDADGKERTAFSDDDENDAEKA